LERHLQTLFGCFHVFYEIHSSPVSKLHGIFLSKKMKRSAAQLLESNDVGGIRELLQAHRDFCAASQKTWREGDLTDEMVLAMLPDCMPTALVQALEAGNVVFLRRLCRVGALRFCNFKDRAIPCDGEVCSFLEVAMRRKVPCDVVRALLEAKCPVLKADLLEVCANDDLELCELLCSRFPDIELRHVTNEHGHGLLYRACLVDVGDPGGVFRYLLSRGLLPFPHGEQSSAFLWCVAFERIDLLELMLPFLGVLGVDEEHNWKQERIVPLALAAKTGRAASARWLLAHGAKHHRSSCAALRYAVERNRLEIVRLLKCPSDSPTMRWVVEKALERNHLEIFEELMQGQTLPHGLLSNVLANPAFLDWCLLHGVLSEIDLAGALEHALMTGPEEAIERLVLAGCDAPMRCFANRDFLWRKFLTAGVAKARTTILAMWFEPFCQIICDYLSSWDEVLLVLAR
jgi:hypothetical protein